MFGNFLSKVWAGVVETPLPIFIGIVAVAVVGAFVASVAYDLVKEALKRETAAMPEPVLQKENRP